VAFEPREAEAAGQTVRNISVTQTGFGPTAVRVGATLWPSHAHVKVNQGDVVTLEGSYNQRTTTDSDTGEERKFHNISVTRILVHGAADQGKKNETVNTDDDSASDDDIPF
jgi:hypothetical protein